jgi:hypothetical protein
VLTNSPTANPDDATQWWEAYRLAEGDQADELRYRADGGDDHARRQLACWLAERGQPGKAVTVIRPLADTGDDIAQLWLARWLAAHRHLDELRELISAPEERFSQLASWRARQGDMDLVRLFAGLGDDDARCRLARRLARQGSGPAGFKG